MYSSHGLYSCINYVAPSWHLLHFWVTSLSLNRLLQESRNHGDFVTTECLVLAIMFGKGQADLPNEALVHWRNSASPKYKDRT